MLALDARECKPGIRPVPHRTSAHDGARYP